MTNEKYYSEQRQAGNAQGQAHRRAGLASFNYINQHYSFQPVGNLRAIRQEFESLKIPAKFEAAGTHYTEFL